MRTHLRISLTPYESLVVVLDNVGFHRSLSAREWGRAQATQVQPFFLPASMSQLSLIERHLRYIKDKVADHRRWSDLYHI
jgi:hypothetical protein